MIYSDYNDLGKKPNLHDYKYHEATHVHRPITMSDEEKSATPIQPNIIGNKSNNKKEDYFFTKSIDYNFDDEDDDDEYYD